MLTAHGVCDEVFRIFIRVYSVDHVHTGLRARRAQNFIAIAVSVADCLYTSEGLGLLGLAVCCC